MPLPSLIESPNGWGAAAGLLAVMIFFSFVAAGYPEQGKIAAFSVCALAGVVGFNWPYRNETWFRGLVAVFLLLHVLLVAIPDWRLERGAALLTSGPATVLDFVVMMLAVTALRKLT